MAAPRQTTERQFEPVSHVRMAMCSNLSLQLRWHLSLLNLAEGAVLSLGRDWIDQLPVQVVAQICHGASQTVRTWPMRMARSHPPLLKTKAVSSPSRLPTLLISMNPSSCTCAAAAIAAKGMIAVAVG